MSEAIHRYGRQGGRWLPKDYRPGDSLAFIEQMRAEAGKNWPDPDAARLADIDLEGRARMAKARLGAGIVLDDLDREALRLYPNPRSWFFPDEPAATDESGDAA